MSHQHHIINKQVLEVHLPEDADVNAVHEDMSRLYRERLIPIINDLCDRHSAPGTLCQIEKLTIDLGRVTMAELEGVFAEKFAEAIAPQKVAVLADAATETNEATAQKTPLGALSYYLMTGVLPWWAPSSSKAYLHQQLDALNQAPSPVFKALLRQVGQKKVYRDRFLNTFSETQVFKTLRSLSPHALDHLPEIKQGLASAILRHPERYSPGLSAQKVANAFWSAVFAQVAIATDPAGLASHAVHQTLRTLGADWAHVLRDLQKMQSFSDIGKRMGLKTSPALAELAAIHQLAENLRLQHRDNPLLQAFCQQLSRMLSHPLFSRIESRQIQALTALLKDLARAQKKAGIADAKTLKVVTETNLVPISRHLQLLDTQLRQMEPPPAPQVMERLHSRYDDTDFITVQNAGLVILWPFLQRFFGNLDLLSGKAFHDEPAQNKAACILQYLAEEEEEGVFEGQLALNKLLCGIKLADPVALEPLSDGDREMAEGLLQAVISRGPHWKNLSLAGFRSSYLQREGLLRSRDGHWLLQVKKETHDITLEKLPWGFTAVKLPWMNEILIVEWS